MLTLLLGCTGSPEPGTVEDSAVSTDTPDTSAPPLSAEDVLGLIDDFYTIGFPDPRTILNAYFDAHIYADEDCPGLTLQMNTVPEGCWTDDGYWFSGLSTYIADLKTESGQGWTLSGEFKISNPKGEVFGAGGAVTQSGMSDKEGWRNSVELLGSWQHEGLDGFLGEGFSGALSMRGGSSKTFAGLILEGAVSYGGSTAIAFNGVMAERSTCSDWFQGHIQIRDAVGRWYDVQFEDCTGCGAVTLDGESLGEACLENTDAVEKLMEILEPSS